MTNELWKIEMAQHPFEQAGLGTAPFRLVEMLEEDSTCQYCTRELKIVCVIADSFGKKSIVGSDCVRQIGDDDLKLPVKQWMDTRTARLRFERQTNFVLAHTQAALAFITKYDDVEDTRLNLVYRPTCYPKTIGWRLQRTWDTSNIKGKIKLIDKWLGITLKTKKETQNGK
jgi:hypothetical protein